MLIQPSLFLFTMIYGGMVVLARELHDMRAIVDQAVEQARPLINAREHSLTLALPAEAAMASELTTLLNQVEAHAGRPAILKLSRAFEKRYRVAGMIERTIWATGGWWPLDGYLAPGYSGRPWVMWTANPRLRSPASDERLHWVVVRP